MAQRLDHLSIFALVLETFRPDDLVEAGRGLTRFACDWLRKGRSPSVANLAGGAAVLLEAELRRRAGQPVASLEVPPVDLVAVPLRELGEALELFEAIAAEIEALELERTADDPCPAGGVDPRSVARLWLLTAAPLRLELERRHDQVRQAQGRARTV